MADIVTGQIFVDAEKGITAAKMNNITGSAVIQPAFYTSKPVAGTADPTDIALILKSGAYAQVPVSTLGGSATQSQIWSTRLRSFNAIGNPNFEVTQRNSGTSVTNPVAGLFIEDRWSVQRAGTFAFNSGSLSSLGPVTLPGTSFYISRNALRVALTTAQASLGAGDYLRINQIAEGSNFRELQGDVHSLSLLVRSSVAGLMFGVALLDLPSPSRSLTKLCTIPSANTWTLIQLANLPAFPSAGTFNSVPGSTGYMLAITLAAGSTWMSPANDTWQNGFFVGAQGMNNFAASPVNSTFDIAMVMHEPGAVCSTFIDKPFSTNLDECQRYFTRSYDYGVVLPVVNAAGAINFMNPTTSSNVNPYVPFKKTMAKTPTVLTYSTVTGAPAVVDDTTNGVRRSVSSYINVGQNSFNGVVTTTVAAAAAQYMFHYTADSGW